jgi:hypothetical protein
MPAVSEVGEESIETDTSIPSKCLAIVEIIEYFWVHGYGRRLAICESRKATS